MTVMQDSIREAMTREKELRRSAENRLVDALETSREGVMLVALRRQNRHVQFHPARLLPGHRLSADARHPVRHRAGDDPEPARCLAQVASEDVTTSGHAELELAGRPLAAHDRQRHL